MRRILFASAFLYLNVAGTAHAIELWEAHLPGLDTGLAAGTLPPSGVYGVVSTYWASNTKYDNAGKKTPIKLDALVIVPVVLWSTGATVLGGKYAVALSQPFDYTNLRLPPSSNAASNGHWGRFNTIVAPALISWDLTSRTSIKTGLFYSFNNASSSPAKPPVRGGVGSGNGNDSWMLEFGITSTTGNWQLNADLMYAASQRDNSTAYKSGDLIQTDFSAIYQSGAFGFGFGGFSVSQITQDSGMLPADCASDGCKRSRFALGPLVTYQAGSVLLSAQYHKDLHTHNGTGGDIVNLRMAFPF